MMAFNLLYFVSGITTVYLEFSETVLRTFPIMSTYTTTYLLSYGTPVTSEESMSRNCRLPGYLYKGTTNVTESGLTCQRWDTQTPHEQNYFVFSLAQENYCRNFDREEPWCYTTNSSVRWELCSVDVCNSPCLNQSFTLEVTSKCLSEEPATDEFCRWIVVIIKCIKRRIENSSGILCSGIEPKSIALHNQNTIEGLIGKSISQCFKSPCTGPRVTTFQGLAKYANPCNIRYPIDKEALETQCPNFLQLANCVVSKIGDETNETCLAKEKISTARGFSDLIPQDAANVSLCISKMSEFPVDAPNEDVTTMGQLLETNVNQTPLIVGIVLAVFFVFIIILIVSLITMRKMLLKKRRKELLRLPSLPKTKESPYEANFTSPNDTYIDPDYEMIEEQDEGYKHLGEQRGGSYIDPDNADGTYLDVVPTSNEKSDGSYINVNPYIEVIDDATENNSVTEAHQEVLLPVENSENSENMTSN